MGVVGLIHTQRNSLISKIYLILKRLYQQRHLFSIRSAFVSLMPIMIIGAYAVVINNLPIPPYQEFMLKFLGPSWKNFGELAFNSTTQIATIMVVFNICNNLANWYNANKNTKLHAGIAGMVGISCYIAMSLSVKDASYIPFSAVGVTSFFGAMLLSILTGEMFIGLCCRKRLAQFIDDDPDVEAPLAFASVVPAVIVIFSFVILRFAIISFGVEEGLTDIINYFLRKPYETNSQSVGTAILYNISTHIMWLFGIHGNNVLDGVATGVFPQVASANGAIITKTFFDVFVYMGGSGTTLALLIALILYGRSENYRTLFKYAFPNGLFNINEPVIFGLPIVLNPIFAIPFVLTPCIIFFTTYFTVKFGLIAPIINDVSWAIPVFVSGYAATGSYTGILLQLFNLFIATTIYIPFVRLSEALSEIHFNMAYKDLVNIVTKDFSSSRRLLAHFDETGTVARQLASELENAFIKKEMFLHYQPIVDVKKNKTHSVEALLRWQHPKHGMVNPMLTIALAEETGLIDELGLWIIEEAIRQRALWTKEGLPDFPVSVNVSGKQLNTVGFSQQVLGILNQIGVPTSLLKLEITETVALVENETTRDNLIELDAKGINIAMDDFGVGHSSLIYLRTMPIHTLKIDSSLSRDVVNQKASLDIISTIYDLCRLMKIETVVEHVENQEQLQKLTQVGDFLIQGYLFSRPLPGSDIRKFIQQYDMAKI